jgi:hypothetical protein
MTDAEIITRDIDNNYQGRGIDVEKFIQTFEQYKAIDGSYFKAEKVIITKKDVGGEVVEIHCMNGGNGRDLTEAMTSLFASLSDSFSRAVTFFDNERLLALTKHSIFPTTLTKIDDGEDRTYQLFFDLRGK